MNEQEQNKLFETYQKNTHRLGRAASVLALLMLLGAPFLIGKFLGSMPDLSAAARGFLAVGVIWLVSSIAEFLVYTPMLGSGGGYLAFITGNLINMKIPCAVNARDTVGAKTGTRKTRSFPPFPLQPRPLSPSLFSRSASRRSRPCSPFCKSRSFPQLLTMSCPHCSAPWHINIIAAT